LADLLNNTTPTGEQLPTLARAMEFRVTARDNRPGGGGINDDDMVVNVCKTKQLTNMRASGADEAIRLENPRRLTLEQATELGLVVELPGRGGIGRILEPVKIIAAVFHTRDDIQHPITCFEKHR